MTRMGKTERNAEAIRIALLVGYNTLVLVCDWAALADMEWRMDPLEASGIVPMFRTEDDESVTIGYNNGAVLRLQVHD